jgi:hypothetical protein
MATSASDITFSFGENWQAFSTTVSEEKVRGALTDIEKWLGDVAGRSVVDTGCGSGIHSLCFTSWVRVRSAPSMWIRAA